MTFSQFSILWKDRKFRFRDVHEEKGSTHIESIILLPSFILSLSDSLTKYYSILIILHFQKKPPFLQPVHSGIILSTYYTQKFKCRDCILTSFSHHSLVYVALWGQSKTAKKSTIVNGMVCWSGTTIFYVLLCALGQWFSNLICIKTGKLERKYRLLYLRFRILRRWWGLRICISSKLTLNPDAVVPKTTVWVALWSVHYFFVFMDPSLTSESSESPGVPHTRLTELGYLGEGARKPKIASKVTSIYNNIIM